MTGGLFYDEHVGGEAMAGVVEQARADLAAFREGARLSADDAAVTIERLVAEIERLRAVLAVDAEFQRVAEAEAAVLRAERDRLREALREIAQSGVYSWAEGKAIESPDGDRHEIAIAAARAALGEDAT